MRACNVRRHKGAVNARVEIDKTADMTKAEKNTKVAIEHVSDLALVGVREGGPLVGWEAFSAVLSSAAGRAIGYGPGRVITRETLIEKHALGKHTLPTGRAVLSYPETEVLQEGQEARHNPAPLLSREQKRAKGAAAHADAEARIKNIEEVKAARGAEIATTYNDERTACARCGARFSGAKTLARHERTDCGRFAARMVRRNEHGSGTIPARLKIYDEDLADEAAAVEEAGLDLFVVLFQPGELYGWTLGVGGRDDAPLSHVGLEWTRAPSDLGAGALVRVLASCWPAAAKEDYGLEWRVAHYYGVSRGRPRGTRLAPGLVLVEYCTRDETGSSHYSQLEIGVRADAAAVGALPALVRSVELGGAASRLLVYEFCEVVKVDGLVIATLDAAVAALGDASVRRRDASVEPRRGTTVTLRRPRPQTVWRGCARNATNRRPAWKWDAEVLEYMDTLLENPAHARRGQAIHELLATRFKYVLDAKKRCVVPSLADVERRMLRAWKRHEQPKRDAAQNAAARALARATGDEGLGDDEEVASDEDDENEDDGKSDDDDAPEAFSLHPAHLSSVGPRTLQELLSAEGEVASASAKQTHLATGTPTSQARMRKPLFHLFFTL